MDQKVQELLLQRPNRNEEEFFATRILNSAGVPRSLAKNGRWVLALKFLKRYVEEVLALDRPYIEAKMFKEPHEALENMRRASWDGHLFDRYVLLARFPGDRLAMFTSCPDMNGLVRRYGTPLTIHEVFENEYLIQHPLESVLKVIEKEYRYDGDSPQD